MKKKNKNDLLIFIYYIIFALAVLSTLTVFMEALYTEFHTLGLTSEKFNSYRGYQIAFGNEDLAASPLAIIAYFLPLLAAISLLIASTHKYAKRMLFLTSILLYLSLVLKLLLPYYIPIPLVLGLRIKFGIPLIVDVAVTGFNSLLGFGTAIFIK